MTRYACIPRCKVYTNCGVKNGSVSGAVYGGGMFLLHKVFIKTGLSFYKKLFEIKNKV